MKQAVILIIFLLSLVALYAAYNIFTFESDQPYEFTFKEPVLPPELIEEQKKLAQNELTPEQQTKRDTAMNVINNAIEAYQNYEVRMPAQASSTLSIFNGYFLTGDLPPHFLGMADIATGRRSYAPLQFSTEAVTIAEGGKRNISCMHEPSGTETLIGNEDDNVIECDSINRGIGNGDRLILGGPGDDKITDTYGNRIVNGGSGNDTIALGPGRSIIVLEDGWGNDQVTVDCSGTSVAAIQIPSDYPGLWHYKTSNFIVISPRINPEDLVWDGLTLKNKFGDDALTVNENCFTVIPAAKQSSNPVSTVPVAQ